jgi:thioesterase domain-containing protein
MIEELQSIWHSRIPISKAMGIQVTSYDGMTLSARAGLAENVNVHGTAFAGSLYAIAALCGWGITWLKLKEAGLEGSIVIASGHIDYARPVSGDIEVACRFDAEAQLAAMDKLRATGRCRFELAVEIGAGAARFNGNYAVLLEETVPLEKPNEQP